MLRSKPVLLAIAAFFAFGLMPIFTREAQANILAIAAWRAILVAAIFGVWTMIAEGGPKALWPDKTTAKLGTWYGLALALASSTFVGGYALTTVANTIFLHNLAPVVAFPLAWWLYKERLSASAITGAAVAVPGVGMLSGVSLFQVSNYASSRFLLGDFLLSDIGHWVRLGTRPYAFGSQKGNPPLGHPMGRLGGGRTLTISHRSQFRSDDHWWDCTALGARTRSHLHQYSLLSAQPEYETHPSGPGLRVVHVRGDFCDRHRNADLFGTTRLYRLVGRCFGGGGFALSIDQPRHI